MLSVFSSFGRKYTYYFRYSKIIVCFFAASIMSRVRVLHPFAQASCRASEYSIRRSKHPVARQSTPSRSSKHSVARQSTPLCRSKHPVARQSTPSRRSKHPVARQSTTSAVASILSPVRVLHPAAASTLSRVRVLYPAAASILSRVRMLADVEDPKLAMMIGFPRLSAL